MEIKEYKGLLISDFTVDNFAACLNNDRDLPIIRSITAPFGQLMQVLMDKNSECWKSSPDFTVIWTRPEIIKSFNKIVNYESPSTDKILKEVDEYASLVLNTTGSAKAIFVPVWVFPFYDRGLGMLDMKLGTGISNTIMRMNMRLSENFKRATNIYLLDAQRWVGTAGKDAFSPKLWYMAKVAFGNTVFIEANKDIKAALRGLSGDSKKLIILDLDETLWGGIVGDLGWENINLGGHDHIGEAYVDFQRALKSLTNRGVILGIVSKNDEAVALEAIKKHPEMVLKLDDFSGWKINWQDKAENIVELVSRLNLGLQSTVFIDDNPAERARVKEALPDVFVPEWPEDKMLYRSVLLSLHCFDAPSISKEDLNRTKMYVSERQKKDSEIKFSSLDEWLKSLEIKVTVEDLNEINLKRAAQLLNKTNQMNLSTRRLTESELLEWARQLNHKLWAFRVSDRFGDLGLTGIISLETKNKKGRIVDFILSCRVIGRKIEETMLNIVTEYASSIGLDEVYAEYIPTAKNKPCLEFFEKSGFDYQKGSNKFTWQIENKYILPVCIQLDK